MKLLDIAKKGCLPVVIVATAVLSSGAYAAGDHGDKSGSDKGGEALARAKDCFYCHESKVKTYGPSFRDIARKYKNLKNADIMLADKIKTGSNIPHWGASEMPPSTSRVEVNEAEAKVLAAWVLKQDD